MEPADGHYLVCRHNYGSCRYMANMGPKGASMALVTNVEPVGADYRVCKLPIWMGPVETYGAYKDQYGA